MQIEKWHDLICATLVGTSSSHPMSMAAVLETHRDAGLTSSVLTEIVLKLMTDKRVCFARTFKNGEWQDQLYTAGIDIQDRRIPSSREHTPHPTKKPVRKCLTCTKILPDYRFEFGSRRCMVCVERIKTEKYAKHNVKKCITCKETKAMTDYDIERSYRRCNQCVSRHK